MGEVHRLPRRPLMLEVDTKELLERGYTYIPFNRVRAFAASELFRRFLSRKSEADKLLWSFGVEDPADPDDGLCRKRGQNGEDYKYFFHWSSILSHLLIGRGVIATDEDWEFLGETGELFSLCRKIAYRVASSIDRSGGISFNFRFEMRKAEINPLPFSRSKLRLNQYDVRDDCSRARPHRDRSLLTIHVGDVGGDLYICDDAEGRGKRIVTPRPDQALVFFGLKAEVLTQGKCRAVWHGAEAHPNAPRSSAVYFAHANLPMQSTWL